MLKSAIDEALASDAGESNAHIGDICGVQLWTDEDLAQASREPTRTDEAIGCLFFIGWIVVIIAGLLAIAWWLMGVLD